jgi:diguanylate cyclase (GGDEF)-like protein
MPVVAGVGRARSLAAVMFSLWLVLVPRVPVAASLDLQELGSPTFSTFSVRDGLPDAVIQDIQVDADGFVWVATPLGLSRYDGHRWRPAPQPVEGGHISELALDAEGTLWLSYRDLGLARYDGERWTLEDASHGLPTQRFLRLGHSRDAHGRPELWALSLEQGLFRRVDGRWMPEPGNEQLPSGPLLGISRSLRIGGRERLWVGTLNEGLWYREDGRWQRFVQPDFPVAQVEGVYSAIEAGREVLWVGTYGLGLWRISGEPAVAVRADPPGLGTDIFYESIEESISGDNHKLWFASRVGLVRASRDGVRVFDRAYGLPSDAIRALDIWRSPDGIEVLWIATETGVARALLRAGGWQTASLAGARGNGVFAVRVEPTERGEERLWVGASVDGLDRFESGRWTRHALPVANERWGAVTLISRSAEPDGSSLQWIGTRGGDLLRHPSGGALEVVATPWPKALGQAVVDMAEIEFDGARELWFATRQSGVWVLRSGQWQARRPDGMDGIWRTVQLRVQSGPDDAPWVWISSDQGVARWHRGHMELLDAKDGLPRSGYRGLNLLPDPVRGPELWVGTDASGIVRVDVSDPAQPRAIIDPPLPAPPHPTAYSALRDSRGRIYVCTNNGVQQLTPKAAGGWDSQVFARRDGMINEECNSNAQFIDAQDRFWTGTLGGLTVFDPSAVARDSQSKPLRLVEVSVDGKPVPTHDLALPWSARELRVEYALLAWHRESESRFRSWLEGHEAPPETWSAHNSRAFNRLDPGRYTLRIEGRDYAGNVSGPLRFPFEVIPTWWQRGWTQALFVLAGLALIYATVRWRLRSLVVQRRRLELEVNLRTAELHQANLRLLDLSYTDALTGLANRRRLLETLDQTPTGPAALVFVDVDHFKDYNDRWGHPAGDEALRRVALALRECAPSNALVARYGGEEFACLLPGADMLRACAVAECIRGAVETTPVPVPGAGQVNYLTISAGIAQRILVSAQDAHQLLREADLALYDAKHAGRNCVRGMDAA